MLLLLLSRFSRVRLCATPWTAAYQAPPSLGFSRQEHWSGLPFPSPGDLPDPGIEPMSPALAGRFFTTNATWEVQYLCTDCVQTAVGAKVGNKWAFLGLGSLIQAGASEADNVHLGQIWTEECSVWCVCLCFVFHLYFIVF